MNRNERLSQSNQDDIFAAAVSRLEAGEAIADILASYPPSLHAELAEILSIVQATAQLGRAPVPLPSPSRRAAAKRDFLAAAAQMRAAQEATSTISPIATPTRATVNSRPAARSAARRAALRRMSLWERFNVGLQSLFSAPALRLAPLIVTLALVLFSTGTLVTLAQTAVPGDLAYTLKQWIRKQELVLAPASQRDLVRQEQERELAADVAKAASRADANSAVIRAEDTQIYYGRNGRLLKIGGLTVMDRYQPDANVEIFKEMSIEGDLLPGTQVSLEYQIMPGQSATVQGIALTVVAPPSDTDVLDTDVLDEVVPGITPPDVGACAVAQPEGWVPYTVRAGDNLTFLASRGGTSITKLMEVNCLQSENILIGDTLYVPAPALETNRPLLTCGSAVPANWTLYEVQAGDSLSVIAARSGISLDELMAINCLNSDIIVIGAQLYVPPAASD